MTTRTPYLSVVSGFKPDCPPRAKSSFENWRMREDLNLYNLLSCEFSKLVRLPFRHPSVKIYLMIFFAS